MVKIRRDFSRMRQSAAALVIGFTLAVIGALLLALMIRGAGLEPKAYALGIRPVSDLINTPNWFSFIVASLAGVVGVVSLTEARWRRCTLRRYIALAGLFSDSEPMSRDTASIRARCVKACGKFPRCWPVVVSISSA